MGADRIGNLTPENDPGDTEQATCTCGAVEVTFNEEAAKGLSAEEVRKRWPRGRCLKCNAIIYASSMHYIAGDW